LLLLVARRRTTGLEKILSLSRDKNFIVRVNTPLGMFFENYRSSQNSWPVYFFQQQILSMYKILTKIGLGYISGDYFKD
jgi:hypothetical protein